MKALDATASASPLVLSDAPIPTGRRPPRRARSRIDRSQLANQPPETSTRPHAPPAAATQKGSEQGHTRERNGGAAAPHLPLVPSCALPSRRCWMDGVLPAWFPPAAGRPVVGLVGSLLLLLLLLVLLLSSGKEKARGERQREVVAASAGASDDVWAIQAERGARLSVRQLDGSGHVARCADQYIPPFFLEESIYSHSDSVIGIPVPSYRMF